LSKRQGCAGLEELAEIMVGPDLKQIRKQLFESGALLRPEQRPPLSASELCDVSLEVQFFSQKCALRDLEPAEGLFFEPLFVEALQILFNRVRSFVDTALRQALLLGVADPLPAIARSLEGEVARWVKVEKSLSNHFHFERGFLWPNQGDAFRRETPGFGQVLVRQVRGSEILESESLFLDALPGWASRWRERKACAPRVSVLAQDGLRVTHAGHAFLTVATPNSFVLVDPVFWPREPGFQVQPWSPQDLGTPGAVFLTHGHGDHFDLQYLLELDPRVPVYVPEAHPKWLGAPLEKLLRVLGLKNVIAVAPGQSLHLCDDLTAEVFDFYGESREVVSFPGAIYGFRRKNQGALCLADTSPDLGGKSLLDDPVFLQAVATRGPYQLIMSTWWQEMRRYYEASPLALLQSGIRVQDWVSPIEFCRVSPEFLRRLVSLTRAQHLSFYAEGGRQLFLPTGAENEHMAAQSLFWKKHDEFALALSGLTSHLSKARPHMWWEILSTGEVIFAPRQVAS
jgi:hypothetical protein